MKYASDCDARHCAALCRKMEHLDLITENRAPVVQKYVTFFAVVLYKAVLCAQEIIIEKQKRTNEREKNIQVSVVEIN